MTSSSNLLPDGQRRCTGCKQVYPNTSEFFSVWRRRGVTYLKARCKTCYCSGTNKWRSLHLDRANEHSKRYFARRYRSDPAWREARLERNRRADKLRRLSKALASV